MKRINTSDMSHINLRPRRRWAWLLGVTAAVTLGWLMLTPAAVLVGLGAVVAAVVKSVRTVTAGPIAPVPEVEPANARPVERKAQRRRFTRRPSMIDYPQMTRGGLYWA